MTKKVRVLVVDDSAIVRGILSKGLELDPDIEVVGSASDPYFARDKIMKLRPDVLTLDVEMPKMDGVEFLRRLMPQYPLPTVMVSSLTERGKEITLQALEAGAVDFVTKPTTDIARGLNGMLDELRSKVKIASRANVSSWKNMQYKPAKTLSSRYSALAESTDKVIAIGASTGGTEAIRQILTQLPANVPGGVIVQHMPAGFTSIFAKSLNQQCAITVKEAEPGDRVMQGRFLIAPGSFHMTVKRSGGIYEVECNKNEKVCGHRPSVEILFQSVAKYVGKNAIGVILTGMGNDGADGLVSMREAGALTIAQDEATSVVFGMPKVAFERGGTDKLVPLHKVVSEVMSMLSEKNQ
ncbi:MAG: chemotaxis response regulator protein-glutamate methylesterase [Caldithrix sp.]|nr:MAG: chemotaxis response regulator protein-glutamate methylesterase [Caldithrix sp.]